jgi:hypothetical protein
VKGNVGNAIKISSSMPMPMPAMALAGGGRIGGEGAGTAVAIAGPGPLTGVGASGAMMVKSEGEGGASRTTADTAAAQEELAQIKATLKDSGLSGKEKSRLRARRNELQEQLGTPSSEPEVRDAPLHADVNRRTDGIFPGKNFKQHFLDHRVEVEKALGVKFPRLKDGGGEALLKSIEQGINDGRLTFVGKGTLKKGEEAMNIYRGNGLTVVTKESGEWVTAITSGEGLDLAIRIAP